jgi:hypothetical protein
MRLSTLGFAVIAVAVLCRIPTSSRPIPLASALEIKMADNASHAFATAAEAEEFLSRAIPAATATNPKYRTPGSEIERRWLAKRIAFRHAAGGGIVVATDEAIEDYRNGAQSGHGTHQAEFALNDVTISPETAGDVTETGEPALGIFFKCAGAPCIHAVWDGQKSVSPTTDIYIQDATQRERILAAFRSLQN